MFLVRSAIGGIASGGMDEGESRLVLNEHIIESGVVGVAIQGRCGNTNGRVAGVSTDWRTICGDEG